MASGVRVTRLAAAVIVAALAGVPIAAQSRLRPARKGGPDFELCVMNADGTGQRQLTDNTVGDLTSSWSLDGRQIVFHRIVSPGRFQLFTIGADGTGERQITDTPGLNGFPKWGAVAK